MYASRLTMPLKLDSTRTSSLANHKGCYFFSILFDLGKFQHLFVENFQFCLVISRLLICHLLDTLLNWAILIEIEPLLGNR